MENEIFMFLVFLNILGIALFFLAGYFFCVRLQCKVPQWHKLKVSYKGITEKGDEIYEGVIYWTIECEDLIIVVDGGIHMISLDEISSVEDIK